jgi:protein ImuA
MRVDSLPSLRLPEAPRPSGVVPLGEARLDQALAGGLRADGLHEFHAAETVDAPAAIAFALLVARLRHELDSRPLIWARQDDALGRPYGPGLVELGIDPESVTLLLLPDGKALLRAGLDCARDGAAAAVLLELHGKQPLLDLTATRRLALAGAQSETMVLIARSAAQPAAASVPSAAHTRWQVRAAPSQPLPALSEALRAPGHPTFALTLLRQRGGCEGLAVTLEWNRDTVSFRQSPAIPEAAPLPGAVPAVAAGGAADPQRQRTG